MKKRFLTTLMAGAMLLTLTACGHTHTPSADWAADLENHWHTCECGEAVESGAHALENDVCTVCGSEVYTYEEGGGYVCIYNARGDLIRDITYSPDGTVENDETLEYVYGEDDGVLNRKSYVFGVLNVETEYGRTADGEVCELRNIYHYEDGRRDVSEYDEGTDLYLRSEGETFEYDEDGSYEDGTEATDGEETEGQGTVDPYAYVVEDDGEEVSDDEEMYRYDE